MKYSLLAALLLIVGCHSSSTPAPVTPPAPALAPVTFTWSPALLAVNMCEATVSCTMQYVVNCDQLTAPVLTSETTVTITLPIGPNFCTLTERLQWADTTQADLLDVSWGGAIQAGAQVVALRLAAK